MKKLLLLLFVLGLTLPTLAQRGDALFFKRLSSKSGVHLTVREASLGIYNNFTIRYSLLYFTQSFEKEILRGRSAGTIKPTTIKAANKKYPGKSTSAIRQRLSYYATESKRGRR